MPIRLCCLEPKQGMFLSKSVMIGAKCLLLLTDVRHAPAGVAREKPGSQ